MPYFVTYSHDLEEPGNFEVENKTALARPEGGRHFAALATELVGLKPDVIVAAPETSLLAVRNVTRSRPWAEAARGRRVRRTRFQTRK